MDRPPSLWGVEDKTLEDARCPLPTALELQLLKTEWTGADFSRLFWQKGTAKLPRYQVQ